MSEEERDLKLQEEDSAKLLEEEEEEYEQETESRFFLFPVFFILQIVKDIEH